MTNATVRLMHYAPRWRQEFEQTRSSILSSCDGWITAVEHIGSTAISGLIARPTIDVIAIGLPQQDHDKNRGQDQELQKASNLIEGLNFRVVQSPLWADGSITMVKPRLKDAESADATHRVFLVQEDSTILRRAVALREYLRQNPETAIEFEEIKVAAWKAAEGNLAIYQRDKSAFFARVQDAME